MTSWLTALAAQNEPVVLVTVAYVKGSVPREAGAKMLVSPAQLFDTIGGGHLELRAAEIARDMLRQNDDTLAAQRRIERFPLGPRLGQCCGGMVHLAFERIDPRSADDTIANLRERWRNRQDTWRMVALDQVASAALLDRDGACIAGRPMQLPSADSFTQPCHVFHDPSGQRWLMDPYLAYRPHLMLFGAGHVGSALVRGLAELPCYVTWVDERDDLFPSTLPDNVVIDSGGMPEAVIAQAARGTSFLVTTHSHALDLTLSEQILKRAPGEWFGLIGSKTKRHTFENRLQERGIASTRLADMICPIGLPGINGRIPAVIAASVAAQLLQVWEAADPTHLNRP